MKICISCGMPMKETSDYPCGDINKDYCIHCARPDGSMQSFDEKRSSMIAFVMREQGFDEVAAIKIVKNNMRQLPAWKEFFAVEE